MDKNYFRNTIIEICNELGIKYTLLSKDWIFKLEKDKKVKFISGFKFDLNNHALGELLDDKYATYKLLKDENIPVIEHNILYSPSNENDFAQDSNDYNLVKEYFINHNNNIVIKPNNGTCGRGVYHIIDINEIDSVLNELLLSNYSISYCPYYNIKNEYRIIILNNKIKLMYKKIRPIIIGNGINTIKELLLEFNYSYFIDKLDDTSYNEVLEKNETFEYNWKFNLSKGAKAELVKDTIKEERLSQIVHKIIEKMDLTFASIDIIETEDNKLYVMEINSGVMMKNIVNFLDNGEIIVKNIYKEAIESLFID